MTKNAILEDMQDYILTAFNIEIEIDNLEHYAKYSDDCPMESLNLKCPNFEIKYNYKNACRNCVHLIEKENEMDECNHPDHDFEYFFSIKDEIKHSV